jgi:hypothetical protein
MRACTHAPGHQMSLRRSRSTVRVLLVLLSPSLHAAFAAVHAAGRCERTRTNAAVRSERRWAVRAAEHTTLRGRPARYAAGTPAPTTTPPLRTRQYRTCGGTHRGCVASGGGSNHQGPPEPPFLVRRIDTGLCWRTTCGRMEGGRWPVTSGFVLLVPLATLSALSRRRSELWLVVSPGLLS